jgi:hypothetical protein
MWENLKKLQINNMGKIMNEEKTNDYDINKFKRFLNGFKPKPRYITLRIMVCLIVSIIMVSIPILLAIFCGVLTGFIVWVILGGLVSALEQMLKIINDK